MKTFQTITLFSIAITAEAFIPAASKISSTHHHRYVSVKVNSQWKRSSSEHWRPLRETRVDEYQTTLEKSSEQFDPMNLPHDSGQDTHRTAAMTQDDESGPTFSLWAARVLLVGVAILCGTNYPAVKYLQDLCFNPPCDHLPSEVALARFGIAAAAGIPFLINQRKDVILGGLEIGLFITLGYFTQALALTTITSGKCALICSLTAIVVPLITALFYKKPVKPINIVSGFLAIIGVSVLEGFVDFQQIMHIQPAVAGTIDSSLLPTTLASASAASTSSAVVESTSTGLLANIEAAGLTKGDLLAVAQPFGFGIAFMRIEHYVEKFKDVPNSLATLAAGQCMTVGLLSLCWVLFDFNGHIPSLEYMIEPHYLSAIAWTGLVSTAIVVYLEGFSLQVAPASDAALTFSTVPAWASLFGAWLLHEKLNMNSYIGGAIIIGAIVLSGLYSGEETETEDAVVE